MQEDKQEHFIKNIEIKDFARINLIGGMENFSYAIKWI